MYTVSLEQMFVRDYPWNSHPSRSDCGFISRPKAKLINFTVLAKRSWNYLKLANL